MTYYSDAEQRRHWADAERDLGCTCPDMVVALMVHLNECPRYRAELEREEDHAEERHSEGGLHHAQYDDPNRTPPEGGL